MGNVTVEGSEPEIADAAVAAAPARMPNFLIIGAMKSGTTSLRAYLDAHPQAFCAQETHFFNNHFDKGLEWYRNHFADAGDVPAVGEKCPSYMYDEGAAGKMARVLPDAKLIAILRDPVDRAYSHWTRARSEGREPLEFMDAVAAESTRVQANGRPHPLFAYIDRGRYLRQLKEVCEFYPREALLVLLFEDLRDAPVKTFRTACTFLGIDDTIIPELVGRSTNTYREYRPAWLYRLMTAKRLWRFLPFGLAPRLGKAMVRERRPDPMDPGARRDIAALYADENAALAAWLGRELSVWTRSG